MVSRTSARSIINKLQEHQAAEIQCLKELYGLDRDDSVDDETRSTTSAEASTQDLDAERDSTTGVDPYSAVYPDSDTRSIISSQILKRDQDIIPAGWDEAWTDTLLQERVREFCGKLCRNSRSRDHSGIHTFLLSLIQT